MDNIQQKPPFKAQAEIEALVKVFSETEPGGIITKAMIQEAIGEHPSSERGRNIIARSIKRALIEHGIVLRTVWKVGYKRLNEDGKVDLSSHRINLHRKQIRRTEHILARVVVEELDNSKKITLHCNQTVVGFLKEITNPKFSKKLEFNAVDPNKALPSVSSVIELFVRPKPKEK